MAKTADVTIIIVCRRLQRKKKQRSALSDQRKLKSAEKPGPVETNREVVRAMIGARTSQ